MPNSDFDGLFSSWGPTFGVDPQLLKSVFHVESSGLLDGNPMGLTPATATTVATRMGWDPKSVDISDMRWAVPIAARVLADGMDAAKGDPDGAVSYYNTGSTKPNPGYIGKVATLYPNMSLQPPDPPDGNAIVSTATSTIGQDGRSIVPWLRSHGQSLDSTKANWCAAYVNATLEANGVRGTTGVGKNVATSFMNWGMPVQDEPQAGDVLVLPKGHPAGGVGGHVGIYAGQTADGPGGTFYLMTSGNEAGRVAYSWERASSVVARRAPELSQPSSSQSTVEGAAPQGAPQQQSQATP